MDECTITTIIENLCYQKDLIAEHGFSLFIKSRDRNILFDTGQGTHFLQNAEVLTIDLKLVTHCVISHGHYDHSGGLPAFLELNSLANIFLQEEALLPLSKSDGSAIGMPKIDTKHKNRLIINNQITEITKNIFIIPPPPIYYEEDIHRDGFFITYKNGITADMFKHEQSLVLINNNSLIVISGCSHRGITNIVRYVTEYFKLPISLLIGGFHIKNESEEHTKKITAILNSYTIPKIAVSHCTGVEKFAILKQELSGHIFYNHTGLTMPC